MNGLCWPACLPKHGAEYFQREVKRMGSARPPGQAIRNGVEFGSAVEPMGRLLPLGRTGASRLLGELARAAPPGAVRNAEVEQRLAPNGLGMAAAAPMHAASSHAAALTCARAIVIVGLSGSKRG